MSEDRHDTALLLNVNLTPLLQFKTPNSWSQLEPNLGRRELAQHLVATVTDRPVMQLLLPFDTRHRDK